MIDFIIQSFVFDSHDLKKDQVEDGEALPNIIINQ